VVRRVEQQKQKKAHDGTDREPHAMWQLRGWARWQFMYIARHGIPENLCMSQCLSVWSV
jgi:hypothetical protein